MRKFLTAIFALCAAFLFVGCGNNTAADETTTYSEMITTEYIEETQPLTKMELLELETGYQDFDTAVDSLDNWYIITYQRELVGNTYLSWEDFDIFESNGKIYAQAEGWGRRKDVIFFIEITEEQCAKILSRTRDSEPFLAFKVDDVAPISFAFYPCVEYSYEDTWSDDTGEYLGEFIGEDSIKAYVDMSSSYILVKGTCTEVYIVSFE